MGQLIFETSIKSSEVDLENLAPAFRKASLNMIMASVVCEKAIQQIADVPKADVGFILGTHFGELDSTLEFLRTYHETQVPRPILFQNSLHNSTLGFITIQLGLTGPSLTVTTDCETVSSAMLMAETLLEKSRYVLVCLIDCIPEKLTPYYLKRYPFFEKHLNKASCMLFSRS